MVQLVSEKRELYRDKLHLLLQSVATVPTDDTVQQEVEEDGDSPCGDDTPGNDADEQIEHFLYDDDGKYLVLNQICNLIQSSCIIKILSKDQLWSDCIIKVVYRIAQIFDGGKYWRIWHSASDPSKFSLSIFQQYSYYTGCLRCHPSIFSLSNVWIKPIRQYFPRQ